MRRADPQVHCTKALSESGSFQRSRQRQFTKTLRRTVHCECSQPCPGHMPPPPSLQASASPSRTSRGHLHGSFALFQERLKHCRSNLARVNPRPPPPTPSYSAPPLGFSVTPLPNQQSPSCRARLTSLPGSSRYGVTVPPAPAMTVGVGVVARQLAKKIASNRCRSRT